MENNEMIAQVQQEIAPVVKFAGALTVTTLEEYNTAGKFLLELKARMKTVKEKLEPMRASAHATYKAALQLIDETIGPLEIAERIMKQRMTAWKVQDDERKRKEEAAAREEARKREDERRMNEALELEKEGKVEEATAILEAPPPRPVVIKPVDPEPKANGIHTRETWQFDIIDESLIPREYMKIDLVAIGSAVRGTKGKVQIPGVRAYAVQSTVARS